MRRVLFVLDVYDKLKVEQWENGSVEDVRLCAMAHLESMKMHSFFFRESGSALNVFDEMWMRICKSIGRLKTIGEVREVAVIIGLTAFRLTMHAMRELNLTLTAA